MNLTLPERIILLSLMPGKGNYITLQLGQDIGAQLNLSQEEIEQGGIKYFPDGTVKWNQKTAESITKDITIGQAGMTLIQTELKRLDDKKDLTVAQMSLYKKFVMDAQPKDAGEAKTKSPEV